MLAMDARRLDHAKLLFERSDWWGTRKSDVTLHLARVARLQGETATAKTLLTFARSEGLEPAAINREEKLLAIQSGRQPPTVDVISKLLVKSPEDGAAVFEAAVIGYASGGDYASAHGLLDQWASAEPDAALLHFYRGEMFLAAGKYDGAVVGYRRALEINSDIFRAHVGLMHAFIFLDKDQEALAEASLVAREQPDNVSVRLEKAMLLKGRDRDDEMLADLIAVLDVQPERYDAVFALAEFYVDNQRWQQAYDLIDGVGDLYADDASLNYLMADACAQLSKTAEAEQRLQKHFDGREKIDELLSMKGNRELAECTIDEKRQLGFGFLKYRCQDAGPFLIDIEIDRPDDAELALAIARLMRMMGDSELARTYAIKATRLQHSADQKSE